LQPETGSCDSVPAELDLSKSASIRYNNGSFISQSVFVNPKSVHLLLPGLFSGFQQSEVETSDLQSSFLLQKLVSKADRRQLNEADKFSADYLRQYPLAYYQYLTADAEAVPVKAVLYATPVNLELKSDHIVARPLAIDDSQQHRLASIIDRFNQHFKDDGLLLRLLPSGQLLCLSSRYDSAQMTPVYAVYGRDIKHFLPEGETAKFWLRIFNETQMLLHEYFEHDQRTFDKQELNSFWFWGAPLNQGIGLVDAAFIGKPDWLKGCCEHHGLKQLALHELAESDQQTIYIIDEALLLAASSGDFAGWLKALSRLEADLIAPLFELLKRGTIQQISLPSASVCYQFKNSHRLRFYRKNKSITELCVKAYE